MDGRSRAPQNAQQEGRGHESLFPRLRWGKAGSELDLAFSEERSGAQQG